MEIRNELLIINGLTFLLLGIILFFPSNILRIALGLPFILFFPGYTLIAVLFPKKEDLGNIERLALSFGLSIALVPLIGLVLNYTPWGIRLYPILLSLIGFILMTSVIAWSRRRNLPPEERFTVSFSFPRLGSSSRLDRALSIILALAILGAIGTLGYVISTPKAGERFTEFYILGREGKAENYPTKLKTGEKGEVILGIINREHEEVSYRIKARVEGKGVKLWKDGRGYEQIGPIRLSHKEKWEEKIGFILRGADKKQKLEFLLYKEGNLEPYRKLHLWIEVFS